MGLFNNEMIQWLNVSLLGIIALLLLILVGLARRVISLLEPNTIISQPTTSAVQAEGVFDEDLAVIMAVMAQKFPGIKNANVQIKPVN
jgi:hypothetical protein